MDVTSIWPPDWALLGAGAALGALASALFFAGLALGVRAARRAARPGLLILGGAALRIALLLGAAWGVAQLGLWAAIGFGAAFFAVRGGAVALARRIPGEAG